MAAHLSPREREYATLVEQLQALEQDIEAARDDARRAESGGVALGLAHDREPPPPPHGEELTLPDGAHIVVRPIEPGDVKELAAGFKRLGALSRYRRFRAPVDELPWERLVAMTAVDHRSEEALVAFDAVGGRGVGMAHYVRVAGEPGRAEFDCVVLDAWQHRGVGTALGERLARRAVVAGIRDLTAHILLGNEGARRLVGRIGEDVSERRDGGVLEVTARLKPR